LAILKLIDLGRRQYQGELQVRFVGGFSLISRKSDPAFRFHALLHEL
jgi:hypothetical protein